MTHPLSYLTLRAAQDVFSTQGYEQAGLREITARAGANLALVNRYFGSKEGLFEQALDAALDISLITDAPRDRFGAALVATFVRDDPTRINPLPMLVLATANAGARAIADRLLREHILTPLAAWFGGPEAEERASRLMLLASGFFLYRLLYPLETWSGDVAPASRAWLATAFQSVVD